MSDPRKILTPIQITTDGDPRSVAFQIVNGKNRQPILTVAGDGTKTGFPTSGASGAVARTGTSIKFDAAATYGLSSAETGNITLDNAGAVAGTVVLLIHNAGSAPTFSSPFKKLSGSGSYVNSVNNYIYMHYVASDKIHYTISQEL